MGVRVTIKEGLHRFEPGTSKIKHVGSGSTRKDSAAVLAGQGFSVVLAGEAEGGDVYLRNGNGAGIDVRVEPGQRQLARNGNVILKIQGTRSR